MPQFLEDVHAVIRAGEVESVTVFNQAQVEDEKLKISFLEDNEDLAAAMFELEDQELLRGSLGAFDLDPVDFEDRATAFDRVMADSEAWPNVLAALLAVGEYQRQRTNARAFLFGTDSKRHDNAWRDLLTGATREALASTRGVLCAFLDRVSEAPTSLSEGLANIANHYLAQCEENHCFDWRYYMVKYPAMRENGSSTYYAERDEGAERAVMGYSLCMLRAGGQALNGYYRDPYLLAIAREVGEGVVEDKLFTGYEWESRRLPLERSGASLRCVAEGFELFPPVIAEQADAFAAVCKQLSVSNDRLLPVPQAEIAGRSVDTIDRIQFGAEVIGTLAASGL
jgi:hypothetical protein